MKLPTNGQKKIVFGSTAESDGRESLAARESWEPELAAVVEGLEMMHFHDFYELASLGLSVDPIGPSVVYHCPVQAREEFLSRVDGAIGGTGWDNVPEIREYFELIFRVFVVNLRFLEKKN